MISSSIRYPYLIAIYGIGLVAISDIMSISFLTSVSVISNCIIPISISVGFIIKLVMFAVFWVITPLYWYSIIVYLIYSLIKLVMMWMIMTVILASSIINLF